MKDLVIYRKVYKQKYTRIIINNVITCYNLIKNETKRK